MLFMVVYWYLARCALHIVCGYTTTTKHWAQYVDGTTSKVVLSVPKQQDSGLWDKKP